MWCKLSLTECSVCVGVQMCEVHFTVCVVVRGWKRYVLNLRVLIDWVCVVVFHVFKSMLALSPCQCHPGYVQCALTSIEKWLHVPQIDTATNR